LSCRELYKNNIQGTIPTELGNLKSLISLDLYNNNISGTIPPSLVKLKSLVFLRLNDNRLTGPIPRELVGISSLKVVDVSNNDLCGTIPTSGPFEHIPLNNLDTTSFPLHKLYLGIDISSQLWTFAYFIPYSRFLKHAPLKTMLLELFILLKVPDSDTHGYGDRLPRILQILTDLKNCSKLYSFEENPRLEGPELLGLASYDTNCS
ncbi:hypothetical protein Goari_000046, partial [Gossypium aridum]|nr:hypothetical protein [Gossypium aridum]